MNTVLRTAIIVAIFSSIFLAVGFFLGQKKSENTQTEQAVLNTNAPSTELRANSTKRLINPLLDCENYNKAKSGYILNLEQEVNNYIKENIQKNKSKHISFYFRSLNNGPWAAYEENYIYAPASLLKVPIMIATLKYAESNPEFLQKKYLYDKALDTEYTPNIKDETIQVGKTYSVEELINYAIVYSDNEAKEILINLIGEESILNAMEDMGVNLRNSDMNDDFITIKQYSSFFRILYNATYLNADYSEFALRVLTASKFVKGIPRKLPQNLVIAHKFGERGFDGSPEKQLHDCGIVYYNNSPYLICIMTKGTDFDQLADIISDISEIVYKHVSSQDVDY